MTQHTVDEAIDALRNGRVIIVADDEDREGEGDLVAAAQLVTPEIVNFMATHGRGLICLTLPGSRCDQLGLPQMTDRNTEEQETGNHRHLGGRSSHHHSGGAQFGHST